MGSARFLSILLVLSLAAEAAYAQTCNMGDGTALLYMASEAVQSGTAFRTWLEGTNCCQWAGVTCNANGRVTALNITSTDIPTATPRGETYVVCSGLAGLLALESVSIRNIGFYGNLPTNIGSLDNLKWLEIDGCNLDGPIPDEYCNLNTLQGLILRNNVLESYPACLDKPSITTFDITGNRFSGPPKRP